MAHIFQHSTSGAKMLIYDTDSGDLMSKLKALVVDVNQWIYMGKTIN